MDSNPINEIEDKKSLYDMGKMGYLVMMGAIAEGATTQEAFLVVKGYFAGIVNGSTKDDEDD